MTEKDAREKMDQSTARTMKNVVPEDVNETIKLFNEMVGTDGNGIEAKVIKCVPICPPRKPGQKQKRNND